MNNPLTTASRTSRRGYRQTIFYPRRGDNPLRAFSGTPDCREPRSHRAKACGWTGVDRRLLASASKPGYEHAVI